MDTIAGSLAKSDLAKEKIAAMVEERKAQRLMSEPETITPAPEQPEPTPPQDDYVKLMYPAWGEDTNRRRKMGIPDNEILEHYQNQEAMYYQHGVSQAAINQHLGRTVETSRQAKRYYEGQTARQLADLYKVDEEQVRFAMDLSNLVPGVPISLLINDEATRKAVQKEVLVNMGKNFTAGTWEQMVNEWRISDLNGKIAQMYATYATFGEEYTLDEIKLQEYKDELARLEYKRPIRKSTLATALGGAAELAEQLGDQLVMGAVGGFVGGPVGAIGAAAAEGWSREVGGMFQELLDLGIDLQTARALSLSFGSISAAIDFVQTRMLLKPFGKPLNAVAKKLIGREIFGVAPEVVGEVFKSVPFATRAARAIANNLGRAAAEIGQEGAQRAVVIAGRELGKYLSGMELSPARENVLDVMNEMAHATPGMVTVSLFGLPFGLMGAASQARLDSKIESQTNVVNQLEADIRSGKVDAEAKVRTGDTTAAVNKGVFSTVLRFFNGTLFQAEQMGEDINPLLVELSLDPEVYEETSDTEDIFIPRRIYENMLAKLPEEQAEMLRNNVRIREEEITYKEKLVRERRALDRLIQDPLLADTEEGAMARALKEKVARNAIERGRPAQEAADCGTLWARLAIIATREAGITVDQFGKLLIKYPDKKTLEAIRRGDYDEAVGLAQRERFQTDTTLRDEIESQTETGDAELDAELDAAEAEAEAELKEAEQSEAEATREVTPEVQAVLDALNRQFQGKKPTSDGPKVKQPRYQNLRPVSPKGVVYRGSYEYDAKRDQHIVTLFSTANSSTLVHEIGHAFLTVLANMATSENASQWVREDWENTKKFLGVGEDGVITGKMNEKFADGFLNYLYKQEAPASALQGVFSRFKRWLAELFQQARISDIELSDGVKDVYAHLIALPGEYDERRQLIREAISEDDRVRIMWEVQELEYWVSMFGEQARDWEDEIFRFFRSQEFAEDYRREAGLTEEQILLERKKDFAYFVKKFMAQELKAVRKERDRALEKLEHETQMKDNANARTKKAREAHAKAVKEIREKYRNQIKEIRAKRDEKIAKLKEEFNDRFAAYKEKNKNRDELKKIIKKLRRMYRDKGLRMTAEYRDILRDTVDQVELRVAKVSNDKRAQREAMRNLMNVLDEQGIEQDDIISALREQGFSAADIVALNQTPLSDMTMADARQFLKDVEAIYEVGVAKRKEELALEHAERAEAAKIMIERINSVAGRGRVITDSKDVHHDYSFGAGMDALIRTEQEMLIHKVDQDIATRKMEGEEISTEERQRLYDEAMQEGRRRAEQNPGWKKLLVNLKHSSEWFTHAATSLLADIARLSDTLDGGKATYDGPFHQIFVREKNACDDNYQRNVERRIGEATFARFINEAGFDIRWLTEKIDLSATDHVFAAYARGQQMTFGDMLGFYLASKDPKAREAAIHGNLNGLPDPKYREAVYERIINGDFMQDKEKWAKGIAFADIVYDILNDNDAFDRMNRVHVKLTNKKVKKEDRYVSIMRMEQVGKFSEVVDPTLASSQNKFLNDDNVLKSPGTPGFTINRVNISDAHQTAILLDPLKILTRHVQAEEHYIAYGEYLKRVFDLMKYDDPTSRNGVSRAIENKFGMFIRDALRRYYNETAVPSIFRAQDTLDNVLGKAARNTAVASLAANTAVLMKNFISVGKWLIDAGPVSVLESLGEFISSPNKFMERVAMMDPQIARRRGNVLLEMQRYDYNTRLGKWNSILNKLVEGNAVIDRWVSSIMFMSVYNHNISKGVDADTAMRMAQESVQRNMQPATYADLPDLWRRGGAFKMLLLFSSEGAKLLQILGFDLPRRLRSGAWVGAGQILIASGICAAIQGLLAHGAPDDDDDNSWYNWYMNAMMEHSVGGLPGIGDVLMQMWSGGYYSSGNSMVQPISNFFYGLRNVFTDDGKRMKSGYTRTEAGIFQLLSSVSMLSGLFPAGATKHFYDAIFKAEDPAEALLILTGNYDVQREARKR